MDERAEIWRGEKEVMKRGLDQLSKVKIEYDFVADKKGPSIIINHEFVMKAYSDVRNRGCNLRLITEISEDNILYCKELDRHYYNW